MEPPYGVREGLLPLFLAAGLKAFPTPRAIRGPKGYVNDLLPSLIEDICRAPGDFHVDVLELSDGQEALLMGLLERFGTEAASAASTDDLVRQVFDAVQLWWHELPESAKTSTKVGTDARSFRKLVRAEDPATTLLEKLPAAFSENGADFSEALKRAKAAADELENVHLEYVACARAAVQEALAVRGIDGSEDLLAAARQWASYFGEAVPLKNLSPLAKATLTQMRRGHPSEESLLNALSLLITEKSFQQWNDATIPEFQRRVRSALEDIEHDALREATAEGADPALTENMAELTRLRLRLALRQIAEIVGVDAADESVRKELEDLYSALEHEEIG